MSVTTKITMTCNHDGCKKVYHYDGDSRYKMYQAAIKEGWQRKNGAVQYCKDHKGKGKVAKPVAKKVPAKTSTAITKNAMGRAIDKAMASKPKRKSYYKPVEKKVPAINPDGTPAEDVSIWTSAPVAPSIEN